LRQLDRYLIEPIADLLPQREGDRLIFMPHQDLFLVPFSALQNVQGRYLIERYSLAVAPSIQVLDRTHARANHLRQRSNQTGQPLIVGNPVMPLWPAHLGKKSSDRPAPLPNSESEARAVAQMLNVQPLTGGNATKNAVLQRLEQASLIHLATHGILDSERGLDSAIALAPMNDGDDGWLTARELLNLDLNAQLVVLSACNTGQGALSGDGIVGLSRSLLAAGAPSAIVTQWAVPDAPTAALMTRFYEFLGQGLDKAAALRQATLATMQQYPDPIDWAAFTLIGDTH
jgi:CHAT domain-containing protein